MILLFLIFLNQSNYNNFYTIYQKNNTQILSTYSYFTPETIKIIENNKSKIIKNIDNKNYFVFDKSLEIIPHFPTITKTELFKIVKDKNINKNILSLFENKELLKIYLNTIYTNVKEEILILFNQRGVSKDLILSKKLKLYQKIEILNSLTQENVIKFKNITKLFLPIFYSDYKHIFTNEYLTYIYNNAVVLKRETIIDALFSIKSFRKIMIDKIFYKENNKNNKIFILNSIIEQEFEYRDKKKLNSTLTKKILDEKNLELLKLYGYFIPKIFIVDNIENIYTQLDKKQKKLFINGFIPQKDIKISQKLMNLIITDFNDYLTFFKLLSYSNKNKIYYKIIKRRLTTYLKKNENEILLNSTLYIDKTLFDILKRKKRILILIIDNLVKNNTEIKEVTKFAKKEVFNLKKNIHLRISLSEYLISNKIYPNRKFLLFIKKIDHNHNLKYKTDELYVSKILPLLSQRYNKKNFSLYKDFLKTKNKIMIETLLNSIYYSKDNRFLEDLKPLLKEKEIFWEVKKVIFSLKNIKK